MGNSPLFGSLLPWVATMGPKKPPKGENPINKKPVAAGMLWGKSKQTKVPQGNFLCIFVGGNFLKNPLIPPPPPFPGPTTEC